MNHMYIMSIFFSSFFFLKKILLFHLGNKILSLVVHWGMKVMDMTKKKLTYDQKVTLTEEPKSLVSWSCSRLFSVFPKLKILKFPKIKAICKKTHYKKNDRWNNKKNYEKNRSMYNVWKELELMDQSMR